MSRRRRLGTRRARSQAGSAGGEILAARLSLGLTRTDAGRLAGVSPQTTRRVEDGDPSVQLDTLCAVGEAVGIDIVVRAYPGRPPSLRDSGQLVVVDWLRGVAHASWTPRIEMAAGDHGEAVDIGLLGPTEILAIEVDRLLLDFQDRYRRNDQKRGWLADRHRRPVRLVMVVEDTDRNRRAVAPHAAIISSVLPAGSREVLRSLRTGEPLGRDGLLWVRRRAFPRR
jgi:transcriptional regulator with XRE-family HTH domain